MRSVASFLAKYQLLVVVGTILLGFVLWQIRDFLLLLFLSYIVAVALLPLLEFLERRNIPKIIGILGIFLIIVGVVVILLAIVGPTLISQTQVFFKNIPLYITRLGLITHVRINLAALQSFITQRIDSISSNVFSFVTYTFDKLFTLSTFVIITIYLLIDMKKIEKDFLQIFPKKIRSSLGETLLAINNILGNWLRGQVTLSAAVGVLSGIVYLLAGLPFVLPLAIFAGIMEIVPTIGPVLAPPILESPNQFEICAGILFKISPLPAMNRIISYFVILSITILGLDKS